MVTDCFLISAHGEAPDKCNWCSPDFALNAQLITFTTRTRPSNASPPFPSCAWLESRRQNTPQRISQQSDFFSRFFLHHPFRQKVPGRRDKILAGDKALKPQFRASAPRRLQMHNPTSISPHFALQDFEIINQTIHGMPLKARHEISRTLHAHKTS